MIIQQSIERKLGETLAPEVLEVVNESHLHSVPPDSETHFKVTVVSAAFESRRRVARHQMVYRALGAELAGPVHALALHTYTPGEWAQRNRAAPASPACLGGSGRERA